MPPIFAWRTGEAQGHLDKAVEINPNDAWIRMVSGLCYHYRGQYELAQADSDEGLPRYPFAPDWYWDVADMVLAASGKYQKALAMHAQPTEIPHRSYCNMAVCHVELGQLEEAPNRR